MFKFSSFTLTFTLSIILVNLAQATPSQYGLDTWNQITEDEITDKIKFKIDGYGRLPKGKEPTVIFEGSLYCASTADAAWQALEKYWQWRELNDAIIKVVPLSDDGREIYDDQGREIFGDGNFHFLRQGSKLDILSSFYGMKYYWLHTTMKDVTNWSIIKSMSYEFRNDKEGYLGTMEAEIRPYNNLVFNGEGIVLTFRQVNRRKSAFIATGPAYFYEKKGTKQSLKFWAQEAGCAFQ